MKITMFLAGVLSTALVGVTVADSPPLIGQVTDALGLPGSEGEGLFRYLFGGGAVTILGGLAFYLAVYVLPQSQEKHAERIDAIAAKHSEIVRLLGEKHELVIEQLTDRFDGWEKLRHEDANALNATLREVVSHCAKYKGG